MKGTLELLVRRDEQIWNEKFRIAYTLVYNIIRILFGSLLLLAQWILGRHNVLDMQFGKES
jgi:hypothetical protein